MYFDSINPFNGEKLAESPIFDNKKLDNSLLLSKKAFLNWKKTSFTHRAALVQKLGEILIQKREELAKIITLEMGKIIRESRAEVEKCKTVCDYYAQNAAIILAERETNFSLKNRIVYEPLGAVFGIMPWNFPFWQVFRFSAAAIMAGNVVLLKHAPNVSLCALAIEKIFLEAGFEEGIFQSLIIDIPQIEYIVKNDIVRATTLTGSERAGASFASLSAKYIKKNILELGGSDAFLVFDDANLDKAAQVAVKSRMLNAGQTCISAKRFFVSSKNAQSFIEKVQFQLQKYQYGNPLENTTNLAPLARLDLAQQLKNQLDRALANGAKKIIGGKQEGCYFEATLVLGNPSNSSIFDEETFGPLMPIFVVQNESEMLNLANQTRYGLAASIWSEDREKAQKIAQDLDVGSVFINALVQSDARLPFGGTKFSGYGRELSWEGIREFTNLKTIVID